MFFTFNDLIRDLVVFTAPISQYSEQEACCEDSHRTAADVLFRYHSLVISRHDLVICATAVEIAAGFQSHSDGFQRIFGHFVVFMEVADRPAIRNEVSLKTPFFSQHLHQSRTCTAWLSVCAVISSHYGFNTGFTHQRPERRQISLCHVFRRSDSIEFMSECFRSAVDCEVLSAGRGLQCLTASLQASYKSLTHAGSQIRVLSVSLMTTAPSRVAEDVDVR